MGKTMLQVAMLSSVAVAAMVMGCDRTPPSVPVTGSNSVAASAVGAGTEDATRFHARGNEPFWSVTVDGASLVYTTPDTQPGVQLMATRSDTASGIEFHGSDGSRAFALVLTPGRCEDSMSDQVYDYTASFNDGERALSGCASKEE